MRRSLTRAARAARSIRQRGYAIVPLPSTMHNLMLSSAPGAVQGMRTLVELAANRAEAGGSVGLSDALFVMRGPASGPHHPARHIVREAVSEAESQALRVARESADAGPAAWYFVAPSKFLGAKRAAYGGKLSFRHGFFEYNRCCSRVAAPPASQPRPTLVFVPPQASLARGRVLGRGVAQPRLTSM